MKRPYPLLALAALMLLFSAGCLGDLNLCLPDSYGKYNCGDWTPPNLQFNIASPPMNTIVLDDSITIEGAIIFNDAPVTTQLLYSLNYGPEVEVPIQPDLSFKFTLTGFEEGIHLLSMGAFSGPETWLERLWFRYVPGSGDFFLLSLDEDEACLRPTGKKGIDFFDMRVWSTVGFTNWVSIVIEGIPEGVMVEPEALVVNPKQLYDEYQELWLTVMGDAPLGTYPLLFRGTGGGLEHTVTFTLTLDEGCRSPPRLD